MSIGVSYIVQWYWWLPLISILAIFLALVFVIYVLMPGFEVIRDTLLFWLFPDSSPLTAYCIFWTIIVLIVCIIIFFITKPKRVVVRDAHYLEDALRSDDRRVAARSIEQLTNQITEGRATAQDAAEIRGLISTNITPIKKFLSKPKSESSVLLVEAPWGMGKTTSILISINELDKKAAANNRYIYESVFKYTGSLDEFEKDLLSSVDDVLTEWGLNVSVDVSELVVNLCSSAINRDFSWILRNIGRRRKNLTTDLIKNINTKFESLPQNKNKWLIIVIDDIDRLQGGDVLEVLSLLSVLRRFCFIKLIISADTAAVAHHLGAIEMYEPHLFIKKYLPEQTSVRIMGEGDMARTLVENRIRGGSMGSPHTKQMDLSAAWAAIAFKLLSNKIKGNSTFWDDELMSGFHWPMTRGEKVPREVNQGVNIDASSSKIILAARRMREGVGIDQAGVDVKWNYIPGQLPIKFEGLLLRLVRKNTDPNKSRSHKEEYVRDAFTERDYIDFVASWFFGYIEKNWEAFGIPIREVADFMDKLEYPLPLSSKLNVQFAEVFNSLFTDKIRVSDEEKEKLE